MSTRDDYIRKMHSRLDHWNADIDRLAAKADQLAADVRVEFDAQIAALRSRRDDARKKLEQLQNAGEGAWQDMKAGMEMAWDAIGEAVDSAKSRFK